MDMTHSMPRLCEPASRTPNGWPQSLARRLWSRLTRGAARIADWRDAARLARLQGATDVHDVERRQRAFERDDADAWSLVRK